MYVVFSCTFTLFPFSNGCNLLPSFPPLFFFPQLWIPHLLREPSLTHLSGISLNIMRSSSLALASEYFPVFHWIPIHPYSHSISHPIIGVPTHLSNPTPTVFPILSLGPHSSRNQNISHHHSPHLLIFPHLNMDYPTYTKPPTTYNSSPTSRLPRHPQATLHSHIQGETVWVCMCARSGPRATKYTSVIICYRRDGLGLRGETERVELFLSLPWAVCMYCLVQVVACLCLFIASRCRPCPLSRFSIVIILQVYSMAWCWERERAFCCGSNEFWSTLTADDPLFLLLPNCLCLP